MGIFCRFGSLGIEPPGGRDELVEGGVNAPGLRLHCVRQGVHVGGLELLHGTVVQDQRDDRMAVGEAAELLLGGHVLAGSGALRLVVDLEPLEQQLAELLGRVEVERPVGEPVQLDLVRGDLLLQLHRILAQSVHADAHPGALHLHQQRHQGHLDAVPQLTLLRSGRSRPAARRAGRRSDRRVRRRRWPAGPAAGHRRPAPRR